MTEDHGVHLEFEQPVFTLSKGKIRRLEDIPNIQAMEIPAVDYLVPGIISRGSLTMWAGIPGAAKSYLILRLAIAVATGGEFLGRRCQKCPVLLIDYANPAHEIRARLDLMSGETKIPDLHVWGIWNEQDPPRIGSELLMSMADEAKALIVFDPFRNAHGCDENSSTEMAAIMAQLTYLKKRGATVIFAHHPGKGEAATSRGSSAIDGAVDMALVQTLNAESQLIELKAGKNRFGELYRICVRPAFDQGTFEVTSSPEFTKQTDEMRKLLQIITETPGMSQNAIWKQSGMMKARLISLLKQGKGTAWREEKAGNSLQYFPIVLKTENNLQNSRTGQADKDCSSVLPFIRENREQSALDPGSCSREKEQKTGRLCSIHKWHSDWSKPNGAFVCLRCHPGEGGEPQPCSVGPNSPQLIEKPNGKTNAGGLPACPTCGSFYVYREPSGVLTCEGCHGVAAKSERADLNVH